MIEKTSLMTAMQESQLCQATRGLYLVELHNASCHNVHDTEREKPKQAGLAALQFQDHCANLEQSPRSVQEAHRRL